MKLQKTVRIKGDLEEVWALVDDVEAVASCIPGMTDIEMRGLREFDSLLTQRVGPVITRFKLRTRLDELEPTSSVTLVSEGREPDLNSRVKAHLRFDFRQVDDGTEIDISADVTFTGQIATFGQRVISSKVEQVIVQALQNLTELLTQRRGFHKRDEIGR